MDTRFLQNCFAGLTAFAAFGLATLGLAPPVQATATLTNIASFTGTGGTGDTNGIHPYAGVTLDSQGNLFGTTVSGGSSDGVVGGGTVWEIPHGTTTLITVASFNGTNGSTPRSGVTFDSSGNMYGTAENGGSAHQGTVWEIAQGSSAIAVVASFNGTNGGYPIGGVTIDSSGNLYGTTTAGGSSANNGFGYGAVWEIVHGTNTIVALAAFNGSGANTNGDSPEAGVTLDSSGNLFGTTEGGGANGFGTVWEIPHGTTTLTALAAFGGNNGSNPYCGVTFDGSGNMYGTAEYGGRGNVGTVWEIAAGTTTILTVASFAGTGQTGDANGAKPAGGVLVDSSGNLFGTTTTGGTANTGTVWEIAHGTNTLTTVTSLTGTGTGDPNGENPTAGLTLDSSGNLFGTAYSGGLSNLGIVFEISGAATTAPPPSHAQLLWTNVNGQAAFWVVNPDFSYAANVYGPFSGYTARAVAEAPNGSCYLLWTNTNGTASLWNITGSGYTHREYGPYTGYTAVSLSVGSDGSPHLLWDKTDGTALLWTINAANGAFTYVTYGPFAGYTANKVASGPSVTDLLWTNTNGTAVGYRIAADGSLTYHTFGPYSGYSAVGLSVGPDNGAHLLWDSTSGVDSLWNADFSSGAYTYTPYGPFSGYSARAIATGPDGGTRMLWDNTSGVASLWDVTGSGYTHHEYGPFNGWTAVAVSAGP